MLPDAFILKVRFSLIWKKMFLWIALILLVAGTLPLAFSLHHVSALSAISTSFGDFNQDNSPRLASTATSLSTNVGGYIITNSNWTLEDSPYSVVADVVVAPSAILTIEPGVIVKFSYGIGLIVDGGLIACGNSTHKITFTSDVVSPETGDWKSILIRSSGGFCNITNAIIEYATTGLDFDSMNYYRQSVLGQSKLALNIVGVDIMGFNVALYEITVENNTDSGIHVDNGDLAIFNSLISKNNIGIRGNYGSIDTIDNCTISNNTNEGISTDGTPISNLLNSKITDNGGRGLSINRFLYNCRNTVISNNSGDGLYVSYQFANIYNSTISFNMGDGVHSEGLSSEYKVTITESTISGNTGNGVSGETVNIAHSSVINNGKIGILSTGIYSNGDIHYCSLYNNGLYDVKNTGTHLNADFNWWGTSNESQIAIRVYDYFDNSSVTGIVNCRPFLNSSSVTLTILTSGVPSGVSVQVQKDNTEMGTVNDETPLNVTFYSGVTQPEMGWVSLSIDNLKISSDNSTTCTFINWTSSEGNSTSNSITLLVAGNTLITAFYDTKVVPEFPSTIVLLLIMILASTISAIMGRKH
jgi:hypothetical protein